MAHLECFIVVVAMNIGHTLKSWILNSKQYQHTQKKQQLLHIYIIYIYRISMDYVYSTNTQFHAQFMYIELAHIQNK